MSKEKPAIEVNNISKAYKINRQQMGNSHPTIKDDFVKLSRKPLELVGLKEKQKRDEFWALKDINFEVPRGEVVGVMGRNGSGKSTLFKILSRITQPTTGGAVLRGKTASLLEVGTGFHPELSGRENVYLNGSILGMKREEIEKKYDDIVAFSEIEKFIDTPVKFYSSGMKVRLAFAVAVHLQAEILIIDEVLAVGDLRFKQKSIERMNEIAASGKTILFVSHITKHIQRICSRGIVLEDGKMVMDDEVNASIEKYLELLQLSEEQRKNADDEDEDLESAMAIPEGVELEIESVDISTEEGTPKGHILLKVENNTDNDLVNQKLLLRIRNQLDSNVAFLNSEYIDKTFSINSNSKSTIEIKLDSLPLVGDVYNLHFVLRDTEPTGSKHVVKEFKAALNIPRLDTNFTEKAFESYKTSMLVRYDINVD